MPSPSTLRAELWVRRISTWTVMVQRLPEGEGGNGAGIQQPQPGGVDGRAQDAPSQQFSVR